MGRHTCETGNALRLLAVSSSSSISDFSVESRFNSSALFSSLTESTFSSALQKPLSNGFLNHKGSQLSSFSQHTRLEAQRKAHTDLSPPGLGHLCVASPTLNLYGLPAKLICG